MIPILMFDKKPLRPFSDIVDENYQQLLTLHDDVIFYIRTILEDLFYEHRHAFLYFKTNNNINMKILRGNYFNRETLRGNYYGIPMFIQQTEKNFRPYGYINLEEAWSVLFNQESE